MIDGSVDRVFPRRDRTRIAPLNVQPGCTLNSVVIYDTLSTTPCAHARFGGSVVGDPSSLLSLRATRKAPRIADGSTVLHAAASAGNVLVLEALLAPRTAPGDAASDDDDDDGGAADKPRCDVWERDLQGRTALHVAAIKGQVSGRGGGYSDEAVANRN